MYRLSRETTTQYAALRPLERLRPTFQYITGACCVAIRCPWRRFALCRSPSVCANMSETTPRKNLGYNGMSRGE